MKRRCNAANLPEAHLLAGWLWQRGIRVRVLNANAAGALGEEPVPAGVTPLSRFTVEGVIVGDDRTWDEVRFDHAGEGVDLSPLLDLGGAEEGFAIVVDPTPAFDHLSDSIATAGDVPPREA